MEIIVSGFPWSNFSDVQEADLWLIYQDRASYFWTSISDNNYEYMLPFTNWGLKIAKIC